MSACCCFAMDYLNNYSSAGHFVAIVGQISSNTYQVIDPGNSVVTWNITINGTSASYTHPKTGSKISDSIDRANRSDEIYQYYNSNATSGGGSHECNKGTYKWYWAVHPHYKCYACSICGEINEFYDETVSVNTCNSCRPGKPVLNVATNTNGNTAFTWQSTSNTSHYNVWLQKENDDGEMKTVAQYFYAESGFSVDLEPGEYRAQLLSYNNGMWEPDESDWVHTCADDVYFTISGERYTVYFDANSGNCSESSRQVASGAAIGELPAASRDGYYLTGWTTSNGTLVDASYPISSNITLYAQWSSDYIDAGDSFYAKLIHKASGHGICNADTNVELGQRGLLNTIWRFERQDNGSYEIISVADGKCLDVKSNNTANGSNVWVYEDNDTIAQRWYIKLTGSGHTFIAANSGKALDVYKGSSDSEIGTNVQLYNAHLGDSQTMSFEKIDSRLRINGTKDLTINHGGDRAYIQVQMPSTIQVTLTSSGLKDTCAVLYDSEWNELASDDDSGPNTNFGLTYTLDAHEIYYYGVYYYSTDTTGTIPVTLQLSSGSELYVNTHNCVAILNRGDTAFREFTPPITARYKIEATDDQDTFVTLYDDEMWEIASNDDSNGGVAFSLTERLVGGSKYFYGIGYYSRNVTGSIPFNLTVAPDVELTMDSTANIQIADAGQSVICAFVPTESTEYSIYSTGDSDTVVTLYNSYLEELTTDDDGGENRNFNLTYTLEAGNVYYYAVRFYGNSTTGSFNICLQGPNPCSGGHTYVNNQCTYCGAIKLVAPTLSVPDSCTTANIQLTWTTVEGATAYKVYRASCIDGPYAFVKSISGTSLSDTGIAAGAVYYYYVEAIDDDGNASSSSAIDYCVYRLPTPVMTLSMDAASGKPIVSWDAVDGAVKYEVYRDTDMTGSNLRLIHTSNTSLFDTDTEPDCTYYYKVAAIAENPYAHSLYSEFASIKTAYHVHTEVIQDAKAPTCTTTGLTEGKYCADCGEILVAQEVIDALGHTEVIDKAVAATCTATGLTEGKHCSVCSEVLVEQSVVPATGHSWDDGVVTRQPQEGVEGEMLYTCTVCNATQVHKIPGLEHAHNYSAVVTAPTCTEQGYTTYTCRCGDSYVNAYTNALGHTEVIDEGVAATCTTMGLTEGKHCSVCNVVLAEQETIDALGHSYSDGICTNCGDVNGRVEAPVVKITNKASNGKPSLSWDAVNGAVEYEVYRATSKTGKYSRVKTTTGTSYTNTSATTGKTYYYYVVSIDEDGIASESSSIVSRTCDLAQPAITLSNVASSGKIKISWDEVDGAVEYEVYCATSESGTYSRIKTTTSTSLTNTSTTAGKTYYYKVRAIAEKSAANSAYSEVKSQTCDLAKTTVTLSNVASTGKIKISWKAVEGATKYEVYRATSKNGTYSRISTTSSTSTTNTKGEAGKTYYYKVRAICDVDAAAAAYSAVKSLTCDLAQPDVSIALSSKKPKVSWDKVTGAVSYKVYRATSKSGTYSLVKTTTSLSYKDTKATSGKTYYYKVIAVCSNTEGNSAYSSIVSIKSK